MDTKPLTELTSYKIYKKDKARIDSTKWHIAQKKNLDGKLSEPELMTALLDYYHEKELNK